MLGDIFVHLYTEFEFHQGQLCQSSLQNRSNKFQLNTAVNAIDLTPTCSRIAGMSMTKSTLL